MSHTVTVFIGIGLFFFILTGLAILDIARKNFGSMGKKGAWGCATLIPFIGPVLYFAIGFRMGSVPGEPENTEPPQKTV